MANDVTTLVDAGIKINSQISFDDLVNVAVSNHEDALHESRAQLQSQIQAVLAENKKIEADLMQKYKQKAEALVIGMFPTSKIDLTGSFHHDDTTAKFSFDFNPVISMPLPEGVTHARNRYYEEEEDDAAPIRFTVNTLTIGVAEEDANVFNKANAEEERLHQELSKINVALQELPRKTRQVKAAIAKQRLAEEGLSDVLANPEIQKILQLK